MIYLSKINDNDILIVPAISEPNKYFLFKDNGLEYTFYIIDDRIHCDSYLNEREKKHIKRYYVKTKALTRDQRIEQMLKQNIGYNEITKQLKVGNHTVLDIKKKMILEGKL